MLSITGIQKTFPARPHAVHALRGVDLEVPLGRLTAILGASGCGKSTLLRIIAGFERPDSGEVRLDQEILVAPTIDVPPERRRIGIVPQEGALFPHLTVGANIAFGLGRAWLGNLSPRTRRQRRERVHELLTMVGLPGYERRWPGELSGGQQQRIALARALAPNPRVVLLDEPFSAIDTALRIDLREEVRALLQSLGTTSILVTHDQAEALSLADHVAVMRDGIVVQAGPPALVYALPADIETATFLGDAILLPGVLVKNGSQSVALADCALGRIPVEFSGAAFDTACTVMLRPEHLRLAEAGTPARVTSTRFFGHEGVARLSLGADGDGPQVTVRELGHNLPVIGAVVSVEVTRPAIAYPCTESQPLSP